MRSKTNITVYVILIAGCCMMLPAMAQWEEVEETNGSAIIQSPYISVDTLQATVVLGDQITVSGVVEDDPEAVQIWVTGENYRLLGVNATVGDDGTFSYTVPGDLTPPAGQCYLVVQHPMTNGVL